MITGGRIESLEGLRGWAALLVLWSYIICRNGIRFLKFLLLRTGISWCPFSSCCLDL